MHILRIMRTQYECYEREKLEYVAIVTHCNLRPPDAAPVLVRSNYDAHAKVQVGQRQPIHSRLSVLLLIRYFTL